MNTESFKMPCVVGREGGGGGSMPPCLLTGGVHRGELSVAE